MKDILKNLYHKNFKLQNNDIKKQKEEYELIKLHDIHEAKLKEALTNENKERLEKLIDCNNELFSICCEEEFVSGFRLGATFIMEIIYGENKFNLSK